MTRGCGCRRATHPLASSADARSWSAARSLAKRGDERQRCRARAVPCTPRCAGRRRRGQPRASIVEAAGHRALRCPRSVGWAQRPAILCRLQRPAKSSGVPSTNTQECGLLHDATVADRRQPCPCPARVVCRRAGRTAGCGDAQPLRQRDTRYQCAGSCLAGGNDARSGRAILPGCRVIDAAGGRQPANPAARCCRGARRAGGPGRPRR